MSVGLLQKKCGSMQAEKHFTAHLRELVASPTGLPDYDITMDAGQVTFYHREGRMAEFVKPPAPVPVIEALEPPAPSKRSIMLSESAIDRVKDLAPGWDKYYLERAYCAWAADKEPAHNEDARFFGWAKSFTKGKRP